MRITISQPTITIVIADITKQELPNVIRKLQLNNPISENLQLNVSDGGKNGFLVQFEARSESKRYVIEKLITLGIIRDDGDITLFDLTI